MCITTAPGSHRDLLPLIAAFCAAQPLKDKQQFAMEYRNLGNSGTRMSTLVLGFSATQSAGAEVVKRA
jgi:hypothetical protein